MCVYARELALVHPASVDDDVLKKKMYVLVCVCVCVCVWMYLFVCMRDCMCV